MAKAVSSFLMQFNEKNVELFVPGVTFKWLGLRRKKKKEEVCKTGLFSTTSVQTAIRKQFNS